MVKLGKLISNILVISNNLLSVENLTRALKQSLISMVFSYWATNSSAIGV